MQWPLRSKGLVTWFILHLVNLASEALPKLGSEPPFSEDSLLSYEFKSNDVAVLRRQQTISRRLNKLTVLILRLLKLTCSDNNS